MANNTNKTKAKKSVIDPDHKLIEEKAEEVNKTKTKNFFSARNIVLISFFAIIAIAIVVCTVLFITPIN